MSKKLNKKIITFAGAVGTSKTPISNYLSTTLGLPVYNNDAVRTEFIEDNGFFDEQKFVTLRNTRLKNIFETGLSFILDASIDRSWNVYQQMIETYDYDDFIISIDVSKNFLETLYTNKNYLDSLARIDNLFRDHDMFQKEHTEKISLHITENNFKDRLEISREAVATWLQ